VRTEGRGRTVDEWKSRASGRDNHWFDCLVGCAVAASFDGASIKESGGPTPKKRVSFAAMQAKKRSWWQKYAALKRSQGR